MDHRYLTFKPENNFKFLSIEQLSANYMDGHLHSEESSTDGITYSTIIDEPLWGAFFFLSSKRYQHTRELWSIIDVMSKFGGLSSTILGLCGVPALFINTRLFMGYLISKIFNAKSVCG